MASPKQLQLRDRTHIRFRLWVPEARGHAAFVAVTPFACDCTGPELECSGSSPAWNSRGVSSRPRPVAWERQGKRRDDGPLHHPQPAGAPAVQIHRHRPRRHHQVGMAGEPAPRLLLLLHGPFRPSQLLRHRGEWEQSSRPLQLDGEDAAALRAASRQAWGELRSRLVGAVRESAYPFCEPTVCRRSRAALPRADWFSVVSSRAVPVQNVLAYPGRPAWPAFARTLRNTALGRQDTWELWPWTLKPASVRRDCIGVRCKVEARFWLIVVDFFP